MKLRKSIISGHICLSYDNPLSLESDISELVEQINDAAKMENQSVVVEFPPDSYLGTEAIGAVIRGCHLMARAGGKFALLSPSPQLLEVRATFELEEYIDILEKQDLFPLDNTL